VKKVFPIRTEQDRRGEPFTPRPELCEIARRCGRAFGIDLYSVDIIESEGKPYVVDMCSIPGCGGVPDASQLLASYLLTAAARAARLVAERWLPALGLGERCPRLLAAAAQREGRWVWHVYEDLRSETLADRCERPRLEAAVDLIAQLHTRGAGHPLLPEVRWLARDH